MAILNRFLFKSNKIFREDIYPPGKIFMKSVDKGRCACYNQTVLPVIVQLVFALGKEVG